MGVEAFLSIFDYDSGTGTSPLDGTDVPITFDTTSFTATIPLSAIGGEASFNFGMVFGTFDEPTDCAPNDGGFIKPTDFKTSPPPTDTPLETPTATKTPTPLPTATVAVTALPGVGQGFDDGTPWHTWALLGASVLALGAAGARKLSRSRS